MGIILSRYRKKKSAEQQLEDIEKEIEDIESNRQHAEQREKYIVWRLIIYSFLLYIISAIVFYVYFFPASLRDQIFYMIPLLIFPIIIVFVKKFITWIYTRKITKNKDKLQNLKKKKKQILDDVMNTETYKVAKQILEKYAPEDVKQTQLQAPNISSSPLRTPSTNKPMARMGNMALFSQSGQSIMSVMSTPLGPNTTPLMGPRSCVPSPRRLIRPIFPKERSYIDRFIDALVGDGPNNRYALICKNCATHNGMALKEEFEYLAFRCVYCGFPNPSLKTRTRTQLSLDYTPSSPQINSNKTEERSESDLNESMENSQDNQQSGVEITEVTDILPENDKITHRKTINTEENISSTTALITEEINIKEIESEEEKETKKTQ